MFESRLDKGVNVVTAYYGSLLSMYKLVYLQYSSQCFCGYDLIHAIKVSEEDCLRPCLGDRTQACGGTWRIAVYENPRYISREYYEENNVIFFKIGNKKY